MWHTRLLPTVLSATGPTADRSQVWIALGLLALMVAALIGAVVLARKLLRPHDPLERLGHDFTLDDLRRLHEDGRLTDAEFARAKQIVAQRGLQAMDVRRDESSDNNP